MADTKLNQLLRRLHQRTIEGNVPWEKTVDEGAFQASFKGFSIRIFPRPTRRTDLEEGEIDYVLQIYNDQGELVEESDDLSFDKNDLGAHPYTIMNEIYTIARRTVMGVEKAIDTLLKELEGKP